MIPVVALAALLATRSVVAKIYDTRFEGTTWDDETWTISTTALDQGHYQSRMSLANGYLGINLAAVGPFFEVDVPVDGDVISGWPLFDRRQTFATISGFFDSQPGFSSANQTNFQWLNQYGGESVISGIPHWSGLHVKVGDEILTATVPPNQISNYTSSLDMRNAVMTWTYTWTPNSGSAIDVEYTVFVHKLYVNQAAVQLKLTAKHDLNVSVVDVLDGDCAVRTTFVEKHYEPVWPMIWSAVAPLGLPDIQAYVVSALVGDESSNSGSRIQYEVESVIGGNSSSIAQEMTVSLKPGRTSTVTKYIGAASSDAFDNPQSTAYQACWNAANEGFAGMLATHSAEWHSIMTPDSVDDYRFPESGSLPNDTNVIELAIIAVTNPFHLLQNTIGTNAIRARSNNTKLAVNSISVAGLGSDSYAGQIFWDAEVWMQPGLVVAYPEAARQIAQYRVEKFAQAQRNVDTAYQSSQNETGKFSTHGAVFPWTSGRYGNCTGTGPCFDYEYHINGDIGLELYNYYAVTGDTGYFQEELFPIYEAVAQFYADLITYNTSAHLYDLLNATDPDEYANFKNNVGYTMTLMSTHLQTANALRERLAMAENKAWANISQLITVPVDSSADIILEYSTMNGSIQVKQADVVLIDDFLEYPNPYTISDLSYYTGRQSAEGPGMTYGVFSIIANRFNVPGCSSYTYDLYSSQPYVRAPWFQFSEQLIDDFTLNGGTHPAFPFLTGMGGSYRVPIFGYLGLRLSLDSLSVDPALPPQIPHLRYRTIYWQGWPISASSNQSHTTLTRLSTPLSNANSSFANTSIPISIGLSSVPSHHLLPNATLILLNRNPNAVKTTPGNIAQCQPVTSFSPSAYEPGQFPLSAIDGAIDTKWQPAAANTSASLTISLPEPFLPITAIEFDWAQAPPTSYIVTFSNSSSSSSDSDAVVVVAKDDAVKVSSPYDAATADEIVAYASNTTNVTLRPAIWSGRFATLTVKGNRADESADAAGAQVAEWAIVAEDGRDVARR